MSVASYAVQNMNWRVEKCATVPSIPPIWRIESNDGRSWVQGDIIIVPNFVIRSMQHPTQIVQGWILGTGIPVLDIDKVGISGIPRLRTASEQLKTPARSSIISRTLPNE